jgi:hypothetical protein
MTAEGGQPEAGPIGGRRAPRRRVLGLAATVPFAVGATRALAHRTAALYLGPVARPLPRTATMVVAGPSGGALDRWAQTIAASLAPGLAPGASIEPASTGARDGVTGANGFGAEAAPDGRTVLLAPGEATISWLVGDPRAKFDVGRWIPVIAATRSGVIIAREGVTLAPGRPVRVAIDAIDGPGLAALAAVEMLGARAEPITGRRPGLDALADGSADVALVDGRNEAALLRDLAGSRLQAVCALPALDPTGSPVRDPAIPNLPDLPELSALRRGGGASDAMLRGYRAAISAARLAFGLVLPRLTPAAMISVWRQAGAMAISAPAMSATAGERGVELLGPPAAAAAISAIAADTEALLALRYWLAARFDWRPG